MLEKESIGTLPLVSKGKVCRVLWPTKTGSAKEGNNLGGKHAKDANFWKTSYPKVNYFYVTVYCFNQ